MLPSDHRSNITFNILRITWVHADNWNRIRGIYLRSLELCRSFTIDWQYSTYNNDDHFASIREWNDFHSNNTITWLIRLLLPMDKGFLLGEIVDKLGLLCQTCTRYHHGKSIFHFHGLPHHLFLRQLLLCSQLEFGKGRIDFQWILWHKQRWS